MADMVCVRTFVGMDNDVNNMGFSHDSKYLAYIDTRVGVAIVDVHTGALSEKQPVTCFQLACDAQLAGADLCTCLLQRVILPLRAAGLPG